VREYSSKEKGGTPTLAAFWLQILERAIKRLQSRTR
jgi:hypothetical protein